MRIALDYDGTVTASYDLWAWFVKMFRGAGHDVRIVTARYEGQYTDDMINFLQMTEDDNGTKIPVIFTNHTPKWEFCSAINWQPGVVIDDEPGIWQKPYTDWSAEQLAEWEAKEGLSDRVVEELERDRRRIEIASDAAIMGDI